MTSIILKGLRHSRRLGYILACTCSLGVYAAEPQHLPSATAQTISAESAFIDENDSAMTRMMTGMAVKPTGDVDHDFVAMMSAHHQGAIDMALTMLKYGHNEQLKRIAQEIIVTQQQEIAAMNLAIGAPLPPSIASPTTPAPQPVK